MSFPNVFFLIDILNCLSGTGNSKLQISRLRCEWVNEVSFYGDSDCTIIHVNDTLTSGCELRKTRFDFFFLLCLANFNSEFISQKSSIKKLKRNVETETPKQVGRLLYAWRHCRCVAKSAIIRSSLIFDQ